MTNKKNNDVNDNMECTMLNSTYPWPLILLLALAPITMMGCSGDDDEEESNPTEAECAANADCPAGFFCDVSIC